MSALSSGMMRENQWRVEETPGEIEQYKSKLRSKFFPTGQWRL